MNPTLMKSMNMLQILIGLGIPAVYLGAAVTGWQCVSKSDKRPITKSPQKSIMLASLILIILAIVGVFGTIGYLKKNIA